jgi:hypothetical protein
VQAGFELATDRAEHRHQESEQRPRSEMQRLLDRVGVDDQRSYTEPELNELLAQAGITDPKQCLALKIECRSLGLMRDATGVERLLRSLAIDGPVDQVALEHSMDQRGYGVTAKNVVKAELLQRGWLRGGGRSMQASAVLTGRDGTPLTLTSRS